MRLQDRVYGRIAIEDPGVLRLIECATFQRLKGIRQAGPSALAFPFKDVTRYEHSLGVYVLLRRLRAPRIEQIAGLLHDISHTAFSHAVDFVFTSEEQDHHEHLKPLMLQRPDVAQALGELGYEPADFFDDSIYPLLEQPIPLLCADRLDYFMRDGLACGVVTREFVQRLLSTLAVVERKIVLCDLRIAREASALFATMNRDWWASGTEAFVYNEFADALREALRLRILDHDDLLTDDLAVLAKLDASGSRKIAQAGRDPQSLSRGHRGLCASNRAEQRWLDPSVLEKDVVRPMSTLGRGKRTSRTAV